MTPLVQHGNHIRLPVPARLPARLGYDAVGMPAHAGQRILHALPTCGCVYAVGRQWWWIVPAGSDIDVAWPSFTTYAPGGYVTTAATTAVPATGAAAPSAPLLIHHPRHDSPYTPPIPLYFLACHIAGIVPYWAPGTCGQGPGGPRLGFEDG